MDEISKALGCKVRTGRHPEATLMPSNRKRDLIYFFFGTLAGTTCPIKGNKPTVGAFYKNQAHALD